MKKVKLTKPELKKQKDSLKRFQRYLPTLQIKKQLLQLEMGRILREIKEINGEIARIKDSINPWAGYLAQGIDLSQLLVIEGIETKKVNVTGVDIPVFVGGQIHIEGNEPLALNGLKKFINSNVNIMLEFHVGVLEKNEGGAYDFAEKLLGIENSKIFIMHVGFKKLIPITSREYFFNIISIMKKQDFPNNLFNLLILKEDNTAE